MNKDQMITVLKKTKQLLSRPDNDFAWSSWEDESVAISDIDSWISRVSDDSVQDTQGLALLFAPTGRIQEVSVSSGWGQEFLDLASRFDEALK